MEIERKFLLRAVPDVDTAIKIARQSQGYFSFDPEVRFRAKWPVEKANYGAIGPIQYFATIKSAGIKVRDEVEGKISQDFFSHMVEKIGKPFIDKIQFVYNYNGLEVAASIVDKDSETSFIYSEVEFESEEEMDKFVWPWPDILIKEVSDDPAYYMQNYWKRTRGE